MQRKIRLIDLTTYDRQLLAYQVNRQSVDNAMRGRDEKETANKYLQYLLGELIADQNHLNFTIAAHNASYQKIEANLKANTESLQMSQLELVRDEKHYDLSLTNASLVFDRDQLTQQLTQANAKLANVQQKILSLTNKNVTVDATMNVQDKQFFSILHILRQQERYLEALAENKHFSDLHQTPHTWADYLKSSIYTIINNYEITHPELSLEIRFTFAKLKITCASKLAKKLEDKTSQISYYFALRGCLESINIDSQDDADIAASLKHLLEPNYIDTNDCLVEYNRLNRGLHSERQLIEIENKACSEAKAAFDKALQPYRRSLRQQFKIKYQEMVELMTTANNTSMYASCNYFTQVYQAAAKCLTDQDPANREKNFTVLKSFAQQIKDQQPESNFWQKAIAIISGIVAIVGMVLSIPLSLGVTLPAIIPAATPMVTAGVATAACVLFSCRANSADKDYRGVSKAIMNMHDSLNLIVKPAR